MWCVAELDEEYIRRMEDVLALYEKPLSEEEPVVCIDEKPVVLHRDIRAPKPARPGHVARRDYEYKRCGTANVFCGVEPKAGRHFPKHGSWLNQAEIEVSLLSRRCLGQRRNPNLATLRGEVRAWGGRVSCDHTMIELNLTCKQARRKLHYSITRTRY